MATPSVGVETKWRGNRLISTLWNMVSSYPNNNGEYYGVGFVGWRGGGRCGGGRQNGRKIIWRVRPAPPRWFGGTR